MSASDSRNSAIEFPSLDHFLEATSKAIEVGGVMIIAIGAVISTVLFVRRYYQSHNFEESFTLYRLNIARGILLGLEFLVAADIIGTVLISPTMENVLVLGLIVLIRTFLSYSLEVEIEGRFPWQKKHKG